MSRGWGACEGQALALRLRRRASRATVVRGPVPRYRSLILAILINPGHPASDVIDIKVLTDLFCLLRRRSIDIKVLSDLVPSVGGGRSARACPSHAFRLKQDGQDAQDGQDGPLGHTAQRSGRP